jgi:hypothetical protein
MPPKTRSKRPIIIGVAAVAVLALVGGVLANTLGSGSNADAAIIRAANSSLADKTARLNVTASVGIGGSTVDFTGAGSIDFTDNAAQMTLHSTAAGRQVDDQLIFLGGIVYEGLPQIAQLAPGKSWISLDLSALQPAAVQRGTAGLGGNPVALLHLLAQRGNMVTVLGASTVDGVAVQGYSVTFDPSAVQSEKDNANLPDWMKRAVSQVKVNGATIKVYVDGAGNLVRYAISMTEQVGSGSLSVSESFDLTDYGSPVSISAPPAAQVLPFDEFLQLAGQSTAR